MTGRVSPEPLHGGHEAPGDACHDRLPDYPQHVHDQLDALCLGNLNCVRYLDIFGGRVCGLLLLLNTEI